MTVPVLTKQQLAAARQAATAARRRRAGVKEQLRRRELTFSEVVALAATDEVVAHLRVLEVLRSVPRIGQKRADELMERFEIAATRRLRGLGRHQVQGLKDELG